MNKRRKSNAAGAGEPAAPQGFVPGPMLQRIDTSQPKLDCSDVGLDGDQELWLLQLPHDFPVGSSVSWNISEHPVDGFRGRCEVEGVEYQLVPDEEAMSAPLYATPSSERGSVVPLTRRMMVVRATAAPLVCFGQQADEAVAAPTKLLSSAGKKALKRKKAAQQQPVPAPVAPTIPQPRGGAAPAAPSTSGQAAAGAEGAPEAGAAAPPVEQPGSTPGAAAAAAAAQQGGDKQPKYGKKRKDKEGGSERSEKKKEKKEKAVSENPESAKKKDKSAKKAKKDKS